MRGTLQDGGLIKFYAPHPPAILNSYSFVAETGGVMLLAVIKFSSGSGRFHWLPTVPFLDVTSLKRKHFFFSSLLHDGNVIIHYNGNKPSKLDKQKTKQQGFSK